jgi:hypothetical protein
VSSAYSISLTLLPVTVFHAIIRAVSMPTLQSDIEMEKFLSDSRSITPNTNWSPLGRTRQYLKP